MEKSFTDLLDDYLFAKAAFDAYMDGKPDYSTGGQILHDYMIAAKEALNRRVPAPSSTQQGEGE